MATGLASIYILAILAPLIIGRLPRIGGWLLALVPAILAFYFALHIPSVSAGTRVLSTLTWLEGMDIRLAFALDGLSLLMAILVTVVGALVLVFSQGYLKPNPDKGRFFAFMLVFMGSMLGLVLTDDLILLFVFWELTSFSSYMLIGHYHDRPEARAAALQALIVTGGGGLALLAGLVLMGQAGGSLRFSELLESGTNLAGNPLYVPIVVLLLLGAFTKSAQFPFHFWLPNAMEAPAPVSAYLHAAAMVKAGIYLLARVSPILGGSDLWNNTLVTVGGATLLIGALLSVRQQDMKRLLAYSTVSALGAMTLLIGLGTAQSIAAAMTFLLAHAMYKGSLFLVAGAVTHATGLGRVDRLGGLWNRMPAIALAGALAGASMAGVPPLMGFIAKEGLLQNVVDSSQPWTITIVAFVAGAMMAAVGLLVGVKPFVGRKPEALGEPHGISAALVVGPLTLAALGAALGLAPALAQPLLAPAADAVLGAQSGLHLSLWHGLNLPLILGITAMAAGGVLYWRWGRVHAWAGVMKPLDAAGPARLYDLGLRGLVSIAKSQTAVLQSGYLRVYILLTVGTAVLLAGAPLVLDPGALSLDWSDVRPHELILAGLIIAGALAAVTSGSWLGAVAALGVVGFAVAGIFILFGAPDLAMTQFLVETLAIILFVLIIYHLPHLSRIHARRFAPWRLVVSAGIGVLTSVLVLAAAGGPAQREIADFYMQRAATEAFGHNVVNVILVDFRAIDTLGEVTVLAVAAMGVYAVVKGRRGPRRPL